MFSNIDYGFQTRFVNPMNVMAYNISLISCLLIQTPIPSLSLLRRKSSLTSPSSELLSTTNGKTNSKTNSISFLVHRIASHWHFSKSMTHRQCAIISSIFKALLLVALGWALTTALPFGIFSHCTTISQQRGLMSDVITQSLWCYSNTAKASCL